MKTFQDLIKQGIAPSRYDTQYIDQNINRDPFIRAYNNVWGIVSDTHMSSYDGDKYIITGSMIKDQKTFSKFLWAYNWGGYVFGRTAAAKVNDVYDLGGFLYKNKLKGTFAKVNGDDVYILTPIEKDCCGCVCKCCGQEDCAIPCRESVIFPNEEIKESILKDHSIEEIVEGLNSNKHIQGNNWVAAQDIDGLKFVNENRLYFVI